jgi:hypothetical protein
LFCLFIIYIFLVQVFSRVLGVSAHGRMGPGFRVLCVPFSFYQPLFYPRHSVLFSGAMLERERVALFYFFWYGYRDIFGKVTACKRALVHSLTQGQENGPRLRLVDG